MGSSDRWSFLTRSLSDQLGAGKLAQNSLGSGPATHERLRWAGPFCLPKQPIERTPDMKIAQPGRAVGLILGRFRPRAGPAVAGALAATAALAVVGCSATRGTSWAG